MSVTGRSSLEESKVEPGHVGICTLAPWRRLLLGGGGTSLLEASVWLGGFVSLLYPKLNKLMGLLRGCNLVCIRVSKKGTES